MSNPNTNFCKDCGEEIGEFETYCPTCEKGRAYVDNLVGICKVVADSATEEQDRKIEQLQAENEVLKERIEMAVDYLPGCPDKARAFLKGNKT